MQAEQQSERERFEAWIRGCDGHPFAGQFANLMWFAWQARAALSHPSTPQGWQPVSSAPKEGLVDILTDGRRYAGCYYDKICSEYRHITACGVLIRLKAATHWMPLPPPPEQGGPDA